MTAEQLKEALRYISKETHLRTKSYRMLSDGVQGEFLQAFSMMVSPKNILEIGTFTGYATLCLSRGLQVGGVIDTIEIDDELTEVFTTAFKIAQQDAIITHSGDAKEIIPTLDRIYDIVYIDANKREYAAYYDLIFPKVSSGGYILVDNVIWSGKIFSQKKHLDWQTEAIISFNDKVKSDCRVEVLTLPVRDGLSLIRKL
ncbi:MAG: class I SAM-dependent methyltransferase [Bacteroidales bacterium]|jgi:caffeoyl-CoA O-methyltransferase|nr:class I SAM-dependent methyltransferase [Bacteroidales bacterium]MBO7256906.1 class I SAM-dependent methyltransferase [Bacteroidales bacterium]MBO7283540.1 class I SAM-dependent methyltransferase [Bacteroidales bacterium]MBR4973993.1 class I SAM-dependent methyltransferase [Bacteroidales bacterium]